MEIVKYQTTDNRVVTTYKEARKVGISQVLYHPIEEDYKKQAVASLIEARYRARKRGK